MDPGRLHLSLAAVAVQIPVPRRERVRERPSPGGRERRRAVPGDIGIARRELVEDRPRPGPCLHRVAARKRHAPWPEPRAGHVEAVFHPGRPVTQGVPGLGQAVPVVVAARHVQVRVVREVVRLKERRLVGRVPCARHVVPLAVEPGHQLEVVGHVLRHRHFHGAVLERGPRVVGLLLDLAPFRIDSSEAAKWLARRRRPEAVDLAERPHVLVAARDEPDVQTRLERELPAVADDPFVHPRLVVVRIKLLSCQCRCGRRREALGLEHAVQVVVVERADVDRAAPAKTRDGVAAHHLLAHAHPGPAQHVSRVLGQQVRHAEARLNGPGFLACDVEDQILALDPVGSHADVEGQPVVRLPVVLEVERPVLIARAACGNLDRVRKVAPERHCPERRIAVVHRHPVFLVEAVVRVTRIRVVHVAGLDEEARLELVRATPACPEPGDVSADQRDRRRGNSLRHAVAALQDQPAPRDEATGDVGALVNLDARSLPLVDAVQPVKRVLAVGPLVVVAHQERRRQRVAPDGGELAAVEVPAVAVTVDLVVEVLPVRLSVGPVVLIEGRQLVGVPQPRGDLHVGLRPFDFLVEERRVREEPRDVAHLLVDPADRRLDVRPAVRGEEPDPIALDWATKRSVELLHP